MYSRRELHQLVLDVELVLISVVQGVALTTLAAEAAPMLRTHDFTTLAFIGTGLLFVLAFWSAALVHAISFLTWPMDLVHYFFYFGVALLECLTFTRMEHPREWFGFSIACFALSWALYLYDDRLIRARAGAYQASAPLRTLYAHITRTQRFEMFVLMPAGLAFNVVAWRTVGAHPGSGAAFALTQFALSAMFLASFVRSFTHRLRLIDACAHD